MTTEAMRLSPELAELRTKYEAPAPTPVASAVGGFAFLSGVYLAISPWVVGFNGFTTLTANDLVIGVALAVLGLGFVSSYARTAGIVWVAPLVGAWAIIAPWVVSGHVASTATIWSNVVTGVVAVLVGLGALSLGSNPDLSSR